MISLYDNTISESDIKKLIDWLGQSPTPRITKGPLTIEFEKLWAKYIGTKYAVFCNSGSSANLLMLYALIASKLLKNNKVVVPGLCWATDLSPVLQFNLEPVLCDINLDTLSVDLKHLEEIFKTEKPACLLLVSILGFSPNYNEIKRLCKEYDVILLGDHCESFGTAYEGNKLGNCGELMSSYSMFVSHHLCTIEGGMVTTNDKDMYDMLIMLRSHGWSRDLDKEKQKELQTKWNIDDFNNLYSFYVPGFNLRSTDLQAFIGIGQLDKADKIINRRNENYYLYKKYLKNDFWMPKPEHNSFTSNFCFPIIHPKRDEIAKALIQNNVETRPLICGSMGKQPMYIEKYGVKELPNCNVVDNYGLYVPNNPSLTEDDIKFVCEIINKVIN